MLNITVMSIQHRYKALIFFNKASGGELNLHHLSTKIREDHPTQIRLWSLRDDFLFLPRYDQKV